MILISVISGKKHPSGMLSGLSEGMVWAVSFVMRDRVTSARRERCG